MKIPSIQGRVVEYWTRKSIQGAIIRVNNRTTLTDGGGMFSMEVPLGPVTLQATHTAFHPYITSLNITAHRAYDIGTVTMQSKVRAL